MDKLRFEHKEYQEISDYLMSLIPKWELEAKAPFMAAFCHEFTGFVEAYYHLSKIIPKDWTVIDFGAGYNAQSYFFTEHKRYIAINPLSGISEDDGMFCPPNCDVYRMTTKQFIKNNEYPRTNVFAICNFVPNWYGEDSIKLVHAHFRNVYTFYPE